MSESLTHQIAHHDGVRHLLIDDQGAVDFDHTQYARDQTVEHRWQPLSARTIAYGQSMEARHGEVWAQLKSAGVKHGDVDAALALERRISDYNGAGLKASPKLYCLAPTAAHRLARNLNMAPQDCSIPCKFVMRSQRLANSVSPPF